MKRTTLLLMLTMVLSVFAQAQMYVPSGQNIYIGNQVTIVGNMTTAGNQTITGGDLNFQGNAYMNNTGATYAGTGYVVMRTPTSGTQTINANGISFQNLRINNTNDVWLYNSPAGVTTNLDFTSGHLVLDTENLVLSPTATMTGYNNSRYIVTDSIGAVVYTNAGAGANLFFPIGNTSGTDYSPLSLTNGTTAQTINVNVKTAPVSPQYPDMVKGMKKVWNLWTSAGAGLASLTLSHTGTTNGAQYTSNTATVNRYISPNWQPGPCPFGAETFASPLYSLGAASTLLTNTSTTATGNAYYSKTSDMPVVAAPTVTSPVKYCEGSVASPLTATGTGLLWYTQSTGGTSSSTAPTPGTTATGNTIYYVSQTVSTCEGNRAAITVTINAKPTIGVNPATAAICAGSTIPITLTATGATSYSWAPPAGLSATTGTSVTALPTNTTTYTITGTDANSCTNTFQKTVTINQLPTITINPTSSSVCAGSSSTLTAGGAGTGSYSWAPNTGLSATTGAVVTATPTGTITYTITGTDINSCINTQTTTVTVNPLPTITVTPPTTNICGGKGATLTATGAGTTGTYSWVPNTNLNTTTGPTVIATPATNTTYTVTGTDANNCVNTGTAEVKVLPTPTKTVVASGPTSFCAGGSVTLGITTGSGFTYQWQQNGTDINAATNSIYTTGVSGTYRVIVNGGGACIDTSLTVTVTAHPLPVPVIVGSGAEMTTSQTYSTYQWKYNNQPINGATNKTYPATQNGSYTVTVTDSNGCTGTSQAFNMTKVAVGTVTKLGEDIQIYPNPAQSIIYIKAPKDATTSIYSMDGRLLKEAKNTTTMDISTLANAVYLIRVTDDNNTLLKVDRLIKN